jgi:chromosomal replication initiator protein
VEAAFIENNGYIDPGFTFDNFVVAPNNESCVLAGKLIIEQPGEIYNPLYIYGGDGLGKTHLIHAIANAFTATGRMKIVCKPAESFLNDLIAAIHDGATQELRHQYRDVDVLIIDDIQFIAGKTSTQEELLCTFDALYDFKTQIVLTSDCLPDEINNLGERIRTRFQTGLVKEMKTPNLETRLAILSKKTEAAKILLDDDASHLLASRFTTNIRELEGALTKLVAYAALTGKTVDGNEDRIRFLERKVACEFAAF